MSVDNALAGVRVVHLTSVHSPSDIRIFQKECVSLAAAGAEVVLVAPHDRHESVSGVEIVPVPRPAGRFNRFFSTAREVVSLGARLDADIYHLHDPELLFWAGGLKRTGGIVVFDMHEDLPRQVKSKHWIPGILRTPVSGILKFLERFLIGSMPVVLAEESYGKCRSWLKNPVEVKNFPRLDWLSELRPDAGPGPGPTLGYIGGVTRERGSLRILEVLAELRDRGHELGFECVGPVSAEHEGELRGRISSLQLGGVTIHGYLDPRRGWAKMAACDIGVALLEPVPNYVESYPTKMFEYMGLGLPVVVSDFPLYRDIMDRFGVGLAVDPLNTSEIAAAVSYLIDNPREAAAMGAKGKEVALAHFNWKSEEENLIGLYRDLVGRASG